MEITTHTIQVGEDQVKIEIWDTPGTNSLKLPLRLHWKDAAGAVVVFDLTDRASFEEANTYLCDLVAMCKEDVFIILVGNKSDLKDEPGFNDVISREEIDNFRERIRSAFRNVSKMRHYQRASTRSIAQFGEETHRVELLNLDLQATLLRNGENLTICFDEKRFRFAIARLDLICVVFDDVELHGEERRFDRMMRIRIRWEIARIHQRFDFAR